MLGKNAARLKPTFAATNNPLDILQRQFHTIEELISVKIFFMNFEIIFFFVVYDRFVIQFVFLKGEGVYWYVSRSFYSKQAPKIEK